MKAEVMSIRADIGTALLSEGNFNTPAKGLTVFIREIKPAGEIRPNTRRRACHKASRKPCGWLSSGLCSAPSLPYAEGRRAILDRLAPVTIAFLVALTEAFAVSAAIVLAVAEL